jgi:hypothetical protein
MLQFFSKFCHYFKSGIIIILIVFAIFSFMQGFQFWINLALPVNKLPKFFVDLRLVYTFDKNSRIVHSDAISNLNFSGRQLYT